ncbi:MAG: DUF1232 domain-containing protein [Alistipes sp.]|jgi:uncharacterized membrane protein YkvA (DUF1232 family)|nr:DUF1232 domain-containing protein [Alistipes sp.]MBQ5876033.1 DUF1232 domain-containing protein [Alistipes sp.]MBR5484564.1 DUF1232 domain-containing protein [Alistipes sp.]
MRKPNDIEKYQDNYSENKLLSKLSSAAKWAGAKVIYAVLLLYYVLRSPNISATDKSKIYGALGYFILPTDLVLDFIPMMGYTDDMAALLWALHTVMNNLTPEIKQQAKDKLADLLGTVDEKKIDEITK